jgi:tRNA/tmRNA/rRNA uracil-C5-methylase (TrmA/RlmC/RlmD family)
MFYLRSRIILNSLSLIKKVSSISTGNKIKIGDVRKLTIENIGQNGVCISHIDGQVVFIRHGIPSEIVEIKITNINKTFLRGDVINVIKPSLDRVIPPCKYYKPGNLGCGGCDFQHINPIRQRLLKSELIREQFLRLCNIDIGKDFIIEEVSDVINWRTRVSLTTDNNGNVGFLSNRSNNVIPIKDCIVVNQSLLLPSLTNKKWKSNHKIDISGNEFGYKTISTYPIPIISRNNRNIKKIETLIEGNDILYEYVLNKKIQVSHSSFWQGHKKSPEILSLIVKKLCNANKGNHILDLYGGVGLFTSSLVDDVGYDGKIDLIEISPSSINNAIYNFKNYSNVNIIKGLVEDVLIKIKSADIVVLDPPRSGASKDVVNKIIKLNPMKIIYVSCDSASLARDSKYLIELGYNLKSLHAFDLFPMTYHVECVALFIPLNENI